MADMACQECLVCISPLENPSTDLCQINVRSAAFHKVSTCQISSLYAYKFNTLSCLQISDEKTKRKQKRKKKYKTKQSKNIIVAVRYSLATVANRQHD